MRLFRTISLVLALGVALSCGAHAGGGTPSPVQVTLGGGGCTPPIGTVLFGFRPDPAASAQVQTLFAADQAARRVPLERIAWERVSREDAERRAQALALLRAGRLSTGQDHLAAAYLFQHGDCPEHYRLANLLAEQAIRRGSREARWIFAATFDRWQRSLGLPQRYGTQYRSVGTGGADPGCNFELEPYDPATTDEERARYDVPPLAEALRRAEEINARCRAARP
ncbi:hypothetical protein [Deinococcus planocerae]|uniref:hypothetical protein n=1 Tax=Deinococcus planocerae TaxID=1737569 RepID=UPI000C7F09A1|nr:hypothetical protein [Deinococcus planocerae]